MLTDDIGDAVFGLLGIIVVVLLVVGLYSCSKAEYEEAKTEKLKPAIITTKEIACISRQNDIGGDVGGWVFMGFGLVSGGTESVPVYYFYVKKDGGFYLDNIPSKGVKIVESDETTPRLEIHTHLYSPEKRKKIIYVPKGTIIKEFKLN